MTSLNEVVDVRLPSCPQLLRRPDVGPPSCPQLLRRPEVREALNGDEDEGSPPASLRPPMLLFRLARLPPPPDGDDTAGGACGCGLGCGLRFSSCWRREGMGKVLTLSSQCTWGPPGEGARAGAGSVGAGVWVRTPGVVVGRPEGLRRAPGRGWVAAGGRTVDLARKGAAAAEAEEDGGVVGPGGLVPVRGCGHVGGAGRDGMVAVVGLAGEGERPGGGRTGLLMLMGLLPVAAEEYEKLLLGDAQDGDGDIAAPGLGAGVSAVAPGLLPKDGSASSTCPSPRAVLAPPAVAAGEDAGAEGLLLFVRRGRGRMGPESGTEAGWGVLVV